MAFLQSQKNAFYEVFQILDLRPADFVWEESRRRTPVVVDSMGVPDLVVRTANQPDTLFVKYRAADYWFLVNEVETDFGPGWSGSCSPGEDRLVDHFPDTAQFTNLIHEFVSWLRHVEREGAEPDLLTQMLSTHVVIDAATDDENDNRPFTPAEQEALGAHVKETANYAVDKFELTGDAETEVRRRFGYLAAAAARVKSIDWLNIAVSQVVSMVTDRLVPKDAFGDLMQFLGRGIAHVLGIAGSAIQRVPDE